MAKISVIGRLASTPEVLPTSTGNDVVRYALATGHGPKDNRYTSWWKVAAFPADNSVVKDILLSLGKGSLVYLEGSCSMGKFTDKNGNQQSSLNIVQRQLEIIERRDPSDGDSLAPAEGE
ncbi:MAG: hypothetical protein LQ342_000647 [Letrouitia transgressa]|nr:MAG: hypothetical protein LQ342_000647 [Letrouitia transgressa]